MRPTRQGDACIPGTLRGPPAPRPVIDREALRDIALGYLMALLKGEAHHRNIRSAELWTPAGPRLRTWA